MRVLLHRSRFAKERELTLAVAQRICEGRSQHWGHKYRQLAISWTVSVVTEL